MVGDGGGPGDEDALRREVVALRARVAELQRAAARHDETEGISLAEREELLREAERVAHLGTWTWQVETGRVTWSDELFRILGLEPGSVTPSVEVFFAAIHPDDRARAQEATETSLREGVLPLFDCRVVRPDGSVRHTTHSSSMLFDAAGVPRRIVGGVLDRTESLATEATLRRTLALLEEAQRFAQLGSWRYDPETHELEWSREFRRIAGIPEDLVAHPDLFLEQVVPEDRARVRRVYQEASIGGEVGYVDAHLRVPGLGTRHVRLTGHRVLGADGRVEVRGTMLDVSDQVRLREELAQAQKMEAVGRLAGGIAHDFNNLLTVITGNLELLAERIGSAPELDGSFQALSSASKLTRRLLTFGRKASLALRVVAPNEIVRSTTTLMRRLVGDEVRLDIELAADLPAVRVDPIEIERALVNLVINARDVMPEGGTVRICSRSSAVEGAPTVELSVADEGPGIDEADRPHIFEPFFTTRAHAGGTGLGLATVLGTAEQHGGTVRAEARAGGGSVFTIVLPAIVDEEAEPMDREPPAGAELDPRPLSLLVIDDEPRLAEVTRRILEGRGHSVWVATEPQAALHIWAERGEHIDLVICDVVMARVRGPELIARLAAQGVEPRVLFVTGYSEEAVRSELRHPVLPKPFTRAELLDAVRAVVRR